MPNRLHFWLIQVNFDLKLPKSTSVRAYVGPSVGRSVVCANVKWYMGPHMLITIKTVVTCLITLLFDECFAFNFFAVQHFVFMI